MGLSFFLSFFVITANSSTKYNLKTNHAREIKHATVDSVPWVVVHYKFTPICTNSNSGDSKVGFIYKRKETGDRVEGLIHTHTDYYMVTILRPGKIIYWPNSVTIRTRWQKMFFSPSHSCRWFFFTVIHTCIIL